MVELALVLPVFLVLLMGIVDFGLGLRNWITITNAAREGARYAAVSCVSAPNDSDVIDHTEDAASHLEDDVTVTVMNCPGASGESVTVAVAHDYTLITPLGGLLGLLGDSAIPNSFSLSSSSDMRLE